VSAGNLSCLLRHSWKKGRAILPNFRCVVSDSDQHIVLRACPVRVYCAARGVWPAASLRGAARQGQALELRVLQVHLRVRRGQRAVHGRGAALVRLVHHHRLPAPPRAVVQGQV
jgi:hypothetical protein